MESKKSQRGYGLLRLRSQCLREGKTIARFSDSKNHLITSGNFATNTAIASVHTFKSDNTVILLKNCIYKHAEGVII